MSVSLSVSVRLHLRVCGPLPVPVLVSACLCLSLSVPVSMTVSRSLYEYLTVSDNLTVPKSICQNQKHPYSSGWQYLAVSNSVQQHLALFRIILSIYHPYTNLQSIHQPINPPIHINSLNPHQSIPIYSIWIKPSICLGICQSVYV